MKLLYSTEATAISGREGRARSADGVLDLDLAVPREMGGEGGSATNPEQLFAAGYAACFGSAVRAVAAKKKAPLREVEITARVDLGQTDTGDFQLAVQLTGNFPGMSESDAMELMRAAHEVCPYSRATRENIQVDLEVKQPSA